MWDFLGLFWPHVSVLVKLLVAVIASGHVILQKRDTRAAIAWVGVIWLAPLVGTGLYIWLGVNRIERRARSLRQGCARINASSSGKQRSAEQFEQILGSNAAHLKPLAAMIGQLTHRSLLYGNRIEPLVNGDQAYPALIQAIDCAARSVSLSTYIFDNDQAGELFLGALQRAAARGVAVRVIVDDIGARYSWPSIPGMLRRAGIPCAVFLPTFILWRFRFTNLRTHRKIMVVDGRIGFTGGMNIREGHCLGWASRYPVQDLHFQVTGPVVTQLQEVFAEDWAFCTGELLQGDTWFTDLPAAGPVIARGLSDGPDEDFESFRMTLLGAVASARSSILIVTPYFLPDASLVTALNVATMRGIDVDIVLPQRNNLRFVQWASTSLLWQLLERGCRVWLSPPPFDHSKIVVVDEAVSFVGSSNWDPRSLRLNFEFNLECYDPDLGGLLAQAVRSKIKTALPVSLADVNRRSLPVKLRDGIARLFSPYL